MEIKAELVKELREKSNAGMMDCKVALVDCKGDIKKAEEIWDPPSFRCGIMAY